MTKATVNSDIEKLNIRNAMSTAPNTDVGDLYAGDYMIGTVLGNWFAFDEVYRVGGQIERFPGKCYAAIANPNNLSDLYLTVVTTNDPPIPIPTPTEPPLPELILNIGGSYTLVNIVNNTDGSITIKLLPK